MGMRYIADELEKAIIKSGYDDVGEFVNQATKEKLEREVDEKQKEAK